MKAKFSIICLVLLTFVNLCCAQSASQILDKAVSKLSKASTVNCKFRITADKNNINGAFKSKGRKFFLDTPVGKTWFDGSRMWTANPKTKEITLVSPTSDEINEVNPFAYLDNYKKKYITGLSKRKDNNNYLVLLNPRSKKDPVKAVEIAINKNTFLPVRFIIRDRNDKVSTVYIDALSLSVKNKDNLFECPTGSMSDYEVIDLR